MKFLYAVKGCSHCDLRESCDLKNHEANLADAIRPIMDKNEPHKIWWTKCKDFFREIVLVPKG